MNIIIVVILVLVLCGVGAVGLWAYEKWKKRKFTGNCNGTTCACGYYWSNNECVKGSSGACNSSSDCKSGYSCAKSACVPELQCSATGAKVAYGACCVDKSSPIECAPGEFYCTKCPDKTGSSLRMCQSLSFQHQSTGLWIANTGWSGYAGAIIYGLTSTPSVFCWRALSSGVNGPENIPNMSFPTVVGTTPVAVGYAIGGVRTYGTMTLRYLPGVSGSLGQGLFAQAGKSGEDALMVIYRNLSSEDTYYIYMYRTSTLLTSEQQSGFITVCGGSSTGTSPSPATCPVPSSSSPMGSTDCRTDVATKEYVESKGGLAWGCLMPASQVNLSVSPAVSPAAFTIKVQTVTTWCDDAQYESLCGTCPSAQTNGTITKFSCV